jgi:hypothetical protein
LSVLLLFAIVLSAKRRRTDNTMVKRRRTDITMVKRRRTDNTMAERKGEKDKLYRKLRINEEHEPRNACTKSGSLRFSQFSGC